MARLVAALLAVALACASRDGGCIVDPCQVTAVVAAPLHPASDEPIGLRVSSALLFSGGTIMASARLANGIIVLDVVDTDHPEDFPGYKPTAETPQDVQAFIGPLMPGIYPIHTTLRVMIGGSIRSCIPQVQSVEVTPLGGGGVTTLAVEFYNAAIDRYVVTATDDEIARLDEGVLPGWVRTGETFPVYVPYQSDRRGWNVFRFYGLPQAGLDSHFLTARSEEAIALQEPPSSDSWEVETDDAFEAPLPDALSGECPYRSSAIHRFFNPRNGDHRYVVSRALRARLLADGWVPEGYGPDAVALCTAQALPQ